MGMAGVMSGVMHAPLMALFLTAELTGSYDLFLPLMITSAVAFWTIRMFESHSIYTLRLAQKGELITHHKDKAVLTLLKIDSVIETDFLPVQPEMTLGDMVKVISKSFLCWIKTESCSESYCSMIYGTLCSAQNYTTVSK